MAEDSTPKLSLSQVLHRILDSLGLHDDTRANLHQLVDDNVTTEQELAERERNPWAEKSDQEVVDAAIAGDKAAAAEYRARKDREAQAGSGPPLSPTPPGTEA